MQWSRGKFFTALGSLGLIGALAIVSFLNRPVPPGYVPPPGLDRSLKAAEQEQIRAATPSTVLFVGDSYTAGGGGIESDATFAAVFCDEWKWMCWRDAEGGTGYKATGMSNSKTYTPYQGRILATKASLTDYKDPQYVIISGGRNDANMTGVRQAADDYFAAVKRTFPESKVIVLLPFWQTEPPAPFMARMRNDVKTAAKANGVQTVSTAGWLKPSLMGDDGVHPTVEGHRQLAHKLEQWMSEHGATSRASDEQSGSDGGIDDTEPTATPDPPLEP